jgi:molybdopterin converting factor small subunit
MVIIKFFGPFEKLAEKESVINIEGSLPLQEFLQILSSRYPSLAPYIEKETQVGFSAYIVFVRNGRPLKLDDIVQNGDTIHLLLPATGG